MNDDNLNDTTTPGVAFEIQRGLATVLPFKPKLIPAEVTAAPADEDIIKMLEYYLERARAGEVTFMALASVGADGIASSTWAPTDGGGEMTTKAMGAVMYLSARFNEAALEGDLDSDHQWTD